LTLTATVASTAGAAAAPARTGSVQFTVDGADAGAPVPVDAQGVATLTPDGLVGVGATVGARYLGDPTSFPSASAAVAAGVVPATTTTSITGTPNPLTSGGTLDVTITVANATTSVVPSGTVQLLIEGVPLGDPIALDGGGRATAQLIASAPAGTYRIGARYHDVDAVADFADSTATLMQRIVAPPAPRASPTSPTFTVAAPSAPATVTLTSAPVVAPRVRSGDLKTLAAGLLGALRTRGVAGIDRASQPFTAAAPGTLTTRVYRAGKVKAKRLLLAAGTRTYVAGGRATLTLRAPAAAHGVLRTARRLRVDLETRFVPRAGGAPVAFATRTTVTRRSRMHQRS
jgi:hypothetical protein